MNKETAFKKIKTEKLIPYINNSKTHSEEQITKLAASIKEFGFLAPIIVDKDLGVLAGHGRLEAAKKLGLKEVPAVMADHLSEAQRKAYIIANWLLPIEKINLATKDAQDMLNTLVGICATLDGQGKPILFVGCLELAWNEIKDRKGCMVAGGAFVKKD